MKPQVPWVLLAVTAALVFQWPDPAAPSRDMPRHCCGSPGPAQLPCTTFWGLLGMRRNTSLCPRCTGCLEQCHGACLGLGLRGACRGERGGRAAGWELPGGFGTGHQGEGKEHVCGVLEGVCLRGQAEVGGRETCRQRGSESRRGRWEGVWWPHGHPKELHEQEVREMAGGGQWDRLEEPWVPVPAVLVPNTFPPGGAGGGEGAGRPLDPAALH